MSRESWVVRGVLAGLVLAAGCQGVSPLTNRIAVGEEPFLVLVGEGPDGWTDLFAVAANGGEAVRFTFTRNRESAPALHPGGAVVAFLRSTPDGPSVLAVMNLVNAAEREVELPAAIGRPERVAWSPDGEHLFVRGQAGVAVSPAPPAPLALEPLPEDDLPRAAADSALDLLLGSPAFARVEPCAAGAEEFCVVTARGERQPLGPAVRHPFRWGTDSLASFDGGRLTVRPLGGGRSRVLGLVRPPANPRDATYFPGP